MIVFAELGDDIVDSETFYKHCTVRMDVADRAQDAKKVETDKRFAVVQLLNDPLEELRLGDADGDRVGDTAYLPERVEEVLE